MRLLVTCFVLFLPLPVAAQTKGYLADFITFATIVDVDTGTGTVPPEYASCAFVPPNTVFTVSFSAGFAYGDDSSDTLYGLEWDGGSGPDIYLYTMAPTGCATGTRVGASPVGSTNLESLAFCPSDGFLYSQSFDFGTHLGVLVRIDPITGLGTVIGSSMPFDVRILGMACGSSGTLWAVTSGHGGLATELYTVDPTTGLVTLVGAAGTASGSLQSLALDGSTLVAAGTDVYHLDAGTGAASLQGGTYDTLWAMAHPVPEPTVIQGLIAGGAMLSVLSRRRTRSRGSCVRHRGPRARSRHFSASMI